MAIIGAVSLAAKRGIVIRDPAILERLDTCRTAIFDKTGTLTYGAPQLTEVIACGGWDRSRVLALAASLETYSKHPLASAVIQAARANAPATMPAGPPGAPAAAQTQALVAKPADSPATRLSFSDRPA